MRKRLQARIMLLAAVSAMGLLCCWEWQAVCAKRCLLLHVPQWVKGGGEIRYHIVIGRDQIRPYGTVWKQNPGLAFEMVPPNAKLEEAWANQPR